MEKKLTSSPLVLLVLFCCFASGHAFGQSSAATLGGSVSDASSALIPGVTVTVRNVATGIVNSSITNESGTYNFPNLQTGTYEVSAELSGFQTSHYTNVTLGGGQQVRLNFSLQVAASSTAVDVTAVADTTLATTSASIGVVLPDMQVRDLPTGDRNVLELLRGVAGSGPESGLKQGYFAGTRTRDTNVTRDGFNVTIGRYDEGANSGTYTSADLVEEVRVLVGTVDASAGRGSGQVQMVTRSGTNNFRGSIFWNNRNSALSAANWFNNFNGAEADWENRNQYGARLGGPIVKNKTFFFFLTDNQRWLGKQNFVGTVFTNQARNGIFRYFPGAANANALSNNPTVDLLGNPVRPRAATGDLQTINLFTADPLRGGYDPSGWVTKTWLARMPQPNDYTVGDGLNTAGIRFTQILHGTGGTRGQTDDQVNRDQINLRLDHHFSPSNKASFVYTWERSRLETSQSGIASWPPVGGSKTYNGLNRREPKLYNFSLVSTLSQSVVNELRVGLRDHSLTAWGPMYIGRDLMDDSTLTDLAKEAFALMPQSNGVPYGVGPNLGGSAFMALSSNFGGTRGVSNPLLTIADTMSWTQGRHSFKAGYEFRGDHTKGYNDNDFTPLAQLGPGNFTAPITTGAAAFPGLNASDATLARNVLYDLSGSVDSVRQGFDLTSTAAPLQFKGYQDGVKLKFRDWRQTEMMGFVTDQWQVTGNLTLNLGLKWEFFGVPFETRGLAARGVGGFQGVCGYSKCGPVSVELVGKNSSQPDKKIYNDDWNNFGPALGLSWTVPGFQRRTIVRAGYGVAFSGSQFKSIQSAGGLDAAAGTLPGAAGIVGGNGLTFRQTDYWSLADMSKIPFRPPFEPLKPPSVADPRTLEMYYFESDRPTPYIQNFNLSVQREIFKDMILDVSYVGSKSTKLYGVLPLHAIDIYNTKFLEAFNVTRQGGNHPLFDQMLMGLNVPGAGIVNGTTLTGSEALRRATATRTDLANGSVGGLASYINGSTDITGRAGGLLGSLPADFLNPYPQFSVTGLNANPSNSNYHSLQVQYTKRLSYGVSNQTAYTWSKTMGESDGDGNLFARNPLNRRLDKARLSFDRTHILTSNATWSLPFGANRALLSGAPAWVGRVVGGWQLGGLLRIGSGAPLNITAGGISTVWQSGTYTPHLLGALPEVAVETHTDGRRPTYFGNVVPGAAGSDPGRADVTATNTLNTSYNRRAIFDAQGNALLVNPKPGESGSLGYRTIDGPGSFGLDMNLVKRVRIDESRELEFRIDASNILNHPNFGDPTTDINSANFGQITSAGEGRSFLIGARLNF